FWRRSPSRRPDRCPREGRSKTARGRRRFPRASAPPSARRMPSWLRASATRRSGTASAPTSLAIGRIQGNHRRRGHRNVHDTLERSVEAGTTFAFLPPDEHILARREEIIAGLADIVSPEALITSARELAPFETDAFTACRNLPLAVVLPASTEEVAAVMAYLSREG